MLFRDYKRILGRQAAAFLGVVVFLFVPVLVLAQTADFGTGYLTGVGLGTQDIRETIVNILRVAYGILGVVTLVLIIYAGFIWMTAGGRQDQIVRAKKIIINAIIGLLIIILAAAITEFIFRQIQDASHGGTGVSCTPLQCVSGCYRCNSAGDGTNPDDTCGGTCSFGVNVFTLNTTQTTHGGTDKKQDVYLCSSLQPIFNNTVATSTIPSNVDVVVEATGVPVSGVWTGIGSTIHFAPDSNFAPNTTYEIQLQTGLTDTSGDPLADCVFPECERTDPPDGYFGWQFTTGIDTDVVPPSIVNAYPPLSPPSQTVSRAPFIDVIYNESIDITTISDTALPPHPLPGSFILEELSGQSGSVVATVDNNNLEVGTIYNGFQVKMISPFLLEPFTWYRITVQNVDDLCGNIMTPMPVVWEFQTTDSVPGVTSTYPANGATNVCPNIAPIAFTFGTSMHNEMVILDFNGDPLGPISLQATQVPLVTETVVPGLGTLRVANPTYSPDPVSNGFTVYEFWPENNLVTGATYTLQVDAPGIVIDSGGGTLQHIWSFTVGDAGTCTCAPFITGLSPSQGSIGQCMTVNGYCFNGTTSDPATVTDVSFISTSFGTHGAPINGQADTYVTTEVPLSIANLDTYSVQLTTTNSFGDVFSNTSSFVVDSLTPYNGPCLYSITPNQACNGAVLTLDGTGFGPDPGSPQRDTSEHNVTFAAHGVVPDPPDVTGWNDTTITMTLPGGYGTSDVTVADNFISSNAVPFTLQCGTGGGNSFDVWSAEPSCGTACPNSAIVVTFSSDIDPTTITDANLDVLPCSDSTCTSFLPELPFSSYIATPSGNTLTLTNLGLATDQDYRVLLHGGVLGTNGSAITNQNYPIGAPISYSWTFKTQGSPCDITSVDTVPTNMNFLTTGVSQQIVGLAYSDQGCGGNNPIDPWPYAWTWWSDTASIADVSHYNTIPPADDPIQDVTAYGLGQTYIHGQAGGYQDQTQVDVALDFQVSAFDPTCTDACPTTQINAYFTSDVDGATVTANNAIVALCTDGAACTTLGPQVNLTLAPLGDRLSMNPTAALTQGAYYRVILVNSILGTNGAAISNVTYDYDPLIPGLDSYTWTFGVSNDDCAVTSVTNSPDPLTIAGLGTNATVWADAFSTDGCGGFSQLNSWLYTWDWSSTDTGIVTVSNSGEPVQDATAVAVGNADITALETGSGLQDPDPISVTVTDPGGLGSSCDLDLSNSMCDPSSTLCQSQYYCDVASCTCADPPPPTIVSVVPTDGSSLECTNTAFVVTFDQPMSDDQFGLNEAGLRVHFDVTHTILPDGTGTCTWIDGCSEYIISPKTVFTPSSIVVLSVGSMESIYGQLTTGMGGRLAFTYSVSATASACGLDGVIVTPPSKLFVSAQSPGNTQDFTALPYSYAAGNTFISPIPGVYDWTWAWIENDIHNLITVGPLTGDTTTVTVPATGQGLADITAEATVTVDTVFGGAHIGRVESGDALIDVFICDFPWEDPPPYDIGGSYNAETKYCRGNIGDPTLLPVLLENTLTTTEPDLLLDRFFIVDTTQGNISGSDIIGLRVFDNPDHTSALGWYQSRGFPQGSPSETVVDGYPAVVDGRTTYIHFTNLTGSSPYTAESYILVLSYNDGAVQETIDIYNELLANLRFNTNIIPSDKVDLQQDMERIGGMGAIIEFIQDLGYPPLLLSGSFIQGMSTSKWPSWQSVLGNELGHALPLDPDNTFSSCPAGYDPLSCFNVNLSPQFSCALGSHIYIYQNGSVYGNLKFKNVNWSGLSVGGAGDNSCGDFAMSWDGSSPPPLGNFTPSGGSNIVITAPTSGTTGSADVTITFNILANGDVTCNSTSGQSTTRTGLTAGVHTCTLIGLPVGTHTLSAQLHDGVNIYNSAGVTYTVTAGPVVGSFSVTPGSAILDWVVSGNGNELGRIEVWRAADSGGSPGVWVELPSLEVDLTGLTDHIGTVTDFPSVGTWHYKILVYDEFNNVTESGSEFVIEGGSADLLPPTITSFVLQPRTITDPITFNYAVIDNTALDQVAFWRTDDLSGAPNPSGWRLLETDIVSGTFAAGSFTDVPNLGEWWYQIEVTDAAGNTSVSSDVYVEMSDAIPIGPPVAPSGLTAVYDAGADAVDLAWIDNSDNEDEFVVERSVHLPDNFTEFATVGLGVTTYADVDMTAGTVYYYQVFARNADGDSGYSNIASAVAGPDDVTAPIVGTFFSFRRLSNDDPISLSYTVTDETALAEVELWRTSDLGGVPDPTNWLAISSESVSGTLASGVFIDDAADGEWWYGLHAIDIAGNVGTETSPLGPYTKTGGGGGGVMHTN